jgi:hypothetical protein
MSVARLPTKAVILDGQFTTVFHIHTGHQRFYKRASAVFYSALVAIEEPCRKLARYGIQAISMIGYMISPCSLRYDTYIFDGISQCQ